MKRAITRLWLVLAAVLGVVAPAMAQDIVVTQGKVEIFDNGMFDFGELRPGGFTSKTFVVRNESPFRIDLGGTVTGAGWTGALNRTTIRAGQRARLVITVDRATSGDKSAVVSITDSNVGGEIFAFSVKAKVLTTEPSIRLTQGRTLLENDGFVSFGRIPEEGATTRVFNLRNIGTANLNLSNFSVTGTGFELVRAPGSNSLKPGATTRFSVRMNGGNPGSRAGAINFQSNAPSDPQFLVELGGTVGEAVPSVQLSQSGVLIKSGDSFHFEETVAGSTLPRRFRIRNNGEGALNLMSVGTSDPQFMIDGLTTTSVGGGQAADFFVVYRPTAEGLTTGTLNIVTNDPLNPSLSVNLSGTAGPPPELRVTLGIAEIQNGASLVLDPTTSAEDMTIFRTFQVANTGEGLLSISFIGVANEGMIGGDLRFRLQSSSDPLELGTGQSTNVLVAFGPPSELPERRYTGSLTLINTDPDESTYTIQLIQDVLTPIEPRGRPAAPMQLLASDGERIGSGDSVDFGASAGDHALIRSFTVTNTTGATLRSGKVSVAGVGFSVVSEPATSLAPGESTSFEIAFDAAGPGRFAAAVTVSYSGDGAQEPLIFAVTAESAR